MTKGLANARPFFVALAGLRPQLAMLVALAGSALSSLSLSTLAGLRPRDAQPFRSPYSKIPS
jgi:hypothetical protein